MLVKVLRGVNWQDALVPVGAALLQAGLSHMEQRRADSEGRLAELEQLIHFRREQAAGDRPLADEPEPAEPEPEPELTRHGWAWLVGGLAVAAAVLAYRRGKPWLMGVFDELERNDLEGAAPGSGIRPTFTMPWPPSTAATPARDSDTHVSCFGADGQCEHAPDGGPHPAAAAEPS